MADFWAKVDLFILVVFIIFVVFMFPFIFPILSNVLIKWNIIDNIGQLEKYIQIFKNFNILVIIGFILFIMYERNISFLEIFSNIFSNTFNRDFSIKIGDNQVELKRNSIRLEHEEETRKLSNNMKEVTKTVLFNGNDAYIENEYEEHKEEEIEAERESLRYFSAYRITDSCSRALLLYIRNNGPISVADFTNNMEKYYQRTRGMGKKRRQEKINNLLYDLKYINIIEYSEDGYFIILTPNGKIFIENYDKWR